MAEQLKLPEVARRLGVSEKTARRYIKSGTLPSIFIGGAYRVEEEDLEAFLQGARVWPTSDDSPKAQRRSSPEPSLFNGLEGERRQYPYPWLADTIARALAEWTRIVEAKENAFYSRTIAVICFDLIDAVTLGYREEWDNLPAEEKPERRQLAEALDNLATRGFEHYKASKAAQEAEVREIERRREEMRRRTQEISA